MQQGVLIRPVEEFYDCVLRLSLGRSDSLRVGIQSHTVPGIAKNPQMEDSMVSPAKTLMALMMLRFIE